MAYIHKKTVNNKNYYTLRISVREKGKVIAKDIANLGNDLSKIKIEELEKNHKEKIRKSYHTIKKTLQSNYYIKKAESKYKKQVLLEKKDLTEIEATKIHYYKEFLKLDEKTQEEILENFFIRFAVNSTSIEGNTITLKQAQKLFKENITPKDKDVREIYDLTNTKKVFYELKNKKPSLTKELIEEIHKKLMENIDNRTGFRKHDIKILGQPFKPSPGRYVKEDVKLLLDWYKKYEKELHPVELATIFHHKFENIHPFSDGNGRTGRMMLNLILLKKKYPPIIIERKERKQYLQALSKADKSMQKSLTNVDQNYDLLMKFISKQASAYYWDIFLN